MRIVLDTASFITAMRSQRGAARQLLRLIASRRVIPCMDYKLSLEYRDVGLRQEQLEASHLSSQQMEAAITALEALAEPIHVAHRLRPISPDPNDDMIIELAVAASAYAIVTNNTRHFAAMTSRFGIAVLTPAQILEVFGKEDQHG